MRGITAALAWTVFLITVAGGESQAQNIQAPIGQFHSANDSVRVHAFYELIAEVSRDQGRRPDGSLRPRTDLLAQRARQQPDLALELLRLLERENVIIEHPLPGSLSQADMVDYRLDLVGVVAGLGDPKTIKALLPWTKNGGSAEAAIVAFGELAVPDLIWMLRDRDKFKRWGAARSLGRIAKARGAGSVSIGMMETIKVALLGTLRNTEDWGLRLTAVQGLAPYSSDDVRVEMRRLAEHDPMALPAGSGSDLRYPVREAARAWLEKHAR